MDLPAITLTSIDTYNHHLIQLYLGIQYICVRTYMYVNHGWLAALDQSRSSARPIPSHPAVPSPQTHLQTTTRTHLPQFVAMARPSHIILYSIQFIQSFLIYTHSLTRTRSGSLGTPRTTHGLYRCPSLGSNHSVWAKMGFG